MEESRSIILKTAEGTEFQVDEAVAMEFNIVKTFFDENAEARDSVTAIPLLNVTDKPLALVIEYCKGHLAAGESGNGNDESFVKDKSNEELKELLLAANYLNISHLLELLTTTIARRIQNKSVEYARKFFGIENDYSQAEEDKLRQENAWAFEDVDSDED